MERQLNPLVWAPLVALIAFGAGMLVFNMHSPTLLGCRFDAGAGILVAIITIIANRLVQPPRNSTWSN